MTDLHYESEPNGASSVEKQKRQTEQMNLFKSLNHVLKKEYETKPFDSICITGDFAMSNPKKDMLGARQIINKILSETFTKYNADRLCVVPGNHDIEWQDFKKKKLSKDPLKEYMDFYMSIYTGSPQIEFILSEMNAWDRTFNGFKYDCSISDLIWQRKLNNSQLNIIGIPTPSLVPENQGLGEFNDQHRKFIEASWGSIKPQNQLRIGIMHHNLFAAHSYSFYDEKNTIDNTNQALLSLMRNSCDLILSGHTHVTNFCKHSISKFTRDGFGEMNNITVLSAGTTGGLHKSGDRKRLFNVIDFSHAEPNSGRREITVTPYQYESEEQEWIVSGAFHTQL